MTRRKTTDVGTVFAVPLSDGTFGLGQVVGREAQFFNSITVALYSRRLIEPELDSVTSPPPDEKDLISPR
jgi:hypothetical protein